MKNLNWSWRRMTAMRTKEELFECAHEFSYLGRTVTFDSIMTQEV